MAAGSMQEISMVAIFHKGAKSMASLMHEIMYTLKTMACVPMALENKAFAELWDAVQIF